MDLLLPNVHKQQQYLSTLQLHGQPQQQRLLLIAVDPDTNGAVATISCPAGETVDMSSAVVQVYDMPSMRVQLPKAKKSDAPRYRRRLDGNTMAILVKQVITSCSSNSSSDQADNLLSASSSSNGKHGSAKHNGNGSSSNNSSGSYIAANNGGSSGSSSTGSGAPVQLRAFLEVSPIQPMNGSLAVLNMGYGMGLWQGILCSAGFELNTVAARQWKSDMGLIKADKDASRALAAEIFPAKQDILK